MPTARVVLAIRQPWAMARRRLAIESGERVIGGPVLGQAPGGDDGADGRAYLKRAPPCPNSNQISPPGDQTATSVCRPYHSSPAGRLTGRVAAASTHTMWRQPSAGLSARSAHLSTQGFHTTTSGKPCAWIPRLRLPACSNCGRLTLK